MNDQRDDNDFLTQVSQVFCDMEKIDRTFLRAVDAKRLASIPAANGRDALVKIGGLIRDESEDHGTSLQLGGDFLSTLSRKDLLLIADFLRCKGYFVDCSVDNHELVISWNIINERALLNSKGI